MASEEGLCEGQYTVEETTLAHEHKEFVVGYIAHSALLLPVGVEVDTSTFTTRVNRSSAGDGRLQKHGRQRKRWRAGVM